MNKHVKAFLLVLCVCALTVTALKSSQKKGDDPSGLCALVGLPAPRYKLAICPVGKISNLSAEELIRVLQITTGETPRILPPFDPPASAYDSQRNQWDCERLVEALPQEEGYVTLGITADDVFTSDVAEWKWCFGIRKDPVAIMSTYRMDPAAFKRRPDPELAIQRRNKMMLRYVLELAYGLKRNLTPESLLYQKVNSTQSLDIMEYRL